MSKTLKTFSVILAVALALSFMSFGTMAVGVPNGDEFMQVALGVDPTEGYQGDYVTVSLNIRNNYYATSLRFPVLFSKDIFEIDEPALDLQKSGQLLSVTGNLSANLSQNPAFFPAGYSSEDYGVVLVQWTGTVNGGMLGCLNQPDGGVCISFRLKVAPTAAGTGTVLIPSESNLFYYQAMNNPADGNTVYVMNPESLAFHFYPASFNTLGVPPGIAPYPGSATVIDRTNFFIYGLDIGLLDLDDHVQPVGGAVLEVVKSGGVVCGTGSVVYVKYNNEVLEVYRVVIFGDVTGDSLIDSMDSANMADYENFLLDWDPVQDAALLRAGDVNGDGVVDSMDSAIIVDYENYLVDINQVTGLTA